MKNCFTKVLGLLAVSACANCACMNLVVSSASTPTVPVEDVQLDESANVFLMSYYWSNFCSDSFLESIPAEHSALKSCAKTMIMPVLSNIFKAPKMTRGNFVIAKYIFSILHEDADWKDQLYPSSSVMQSTPMLREISLSISWVIMGCILTSFKLSADEPCLNMDVAQSTSDSIGLQKTLGSLRRVEDFILGSLFKRESFTPSLEYCNAELAKISLSLDESLDKLYTSFGLDTNSLFYPLCNSEKITHGEVLKASRFMDVLCEDPWFSEVINSSSKDKHLSTLCCIIISLKVSRSNVNTNEHFAEITKVDVDTINACEKAIMSTLEKNNAFT